MKLKKPPTCQLGQTRSGKLVKIPLTTKIEILNNFCESFTGPDQVDLCMLIEYLVMKLVDTKQLLDEVEPIIETHTILDGKRLSWAYDNEFLLLNIKTSVDRYNFGKKLAHQLYRS